MAEHMSSSESSSPRGLAATPLARGVSRWIDVALIGSLVAFAASVALQRIRTFDYWWHLRTGGLIAETGAVPLVDPYTYTVPGARWIDVHWLHQLGLHALHSLGGHEAVTFAKLFFVLLLIGVLAVIGFRRERLGLTVLGLALVLLAVADRVMPRPELPSFVLLAAVLALYERFARRGDAWIYAVVPLQILWGNIHGLFALGLAVAAIHLGTELIRPLVAPGQGLRPARLRRLASVLVLASLASLANPNGLDGALYPLQQLGMIGPIEDRGFFGSTIAELHPMLAGSRPAALFLRYVFLGLAAVSLAAMAANWRRMAASDPLLWASFGYLALGAQRNLAFFAIVAVPIAVRNLGEVLDARPPGSWPLMRTRWPRPAARALLACGLVALCVDTASGRFFARIGASREPGLTPMELVYPIGAADWIAEHRPVGPICHHMAAGGYLIWRLYPDYKVMTDGRLEVFGEERFAELQVVNVETLRNLDEQYHFGAVLVHYSLLPSEALLRWLHLNPRWRLVFVDDVAALFVRADSPGGLVPEVDLDAPDLFPALEGPVGWNDMARRFARVSFYSAMHRFEAALTLWEETLALYPDTKDGAVIHASLLRRNGRGAAAEAILLSLLEARPTDPKLHVQIGDLNLENDDRDTARRFYDAALALDPKLPLALLRRAEIAEQDGDLDEAVQLYLRALAQLPAAHPIAVVSMTRLRAIDAGTAWLP